jgi:hypothetical protein
MLFEVLPDPRPFAAPAKAQGPVEVLQFHRTIPDRVPIGHFEPGGREVVDQVVDRHAYLGWIRQACAARGDALEIRFYDHVDGGFDARVLDDLPEIRRLSIDGVPSVRHPDAVGRLPALTALRFGPRAVDDSRVLGALGVHRLTHFTLSGSPAPALDLAPLAEARGLTSLRLLGHGKNTEALAHLTSLRELAIHPSSKVSLEFMNRLVALESLKFVLGTAPTIAAIERLGHLRDLSFREVRNLQELGDLQRFPRLRRLQVIGQPKVETVLVGAMNTALEHLYLYSVPRLHAIGGFSALPAVKSLFAYDSRLDLLRSGLPRTLTHFQLLTKAVKGRAAHEALVRENGLVPAPHPDAHFFYK